MSSKHYFFLNLSIIITISLQLIGCNSKDDEPVIPAPETNLGYGFGITRYANIEVPMSDFNYSIDKGISITAKPEESGEILITLPEWGTLPEDEKPDNLEPSVTHYMSEYYQSDITHKPNGLILDKYGIEIEWADESTPTYRLIISPITSPQVGMHGQTVSFEKEITRPVPNADEHYSWKFYSDKFLITIARK